MTNYGPEDSLYSSVGQQSDNQSTLLKRKLVETHQKLLQELELTKDLEQQVVTSQMKNQQLRIENQSLKRKISSKSNDESKGLQRKLKEYQNKNDLLRNDLEAMRTRIISQMLQKTKLQESVQSKNQIIAELEATNRKLLSQIKRKQGQMNNKISDYQDIKAKYEQMYCDITKSQNLCEQLKRKQVFFTSRINDLQNFLKVQKQKSNNSSNDKKILQKQLANLKNKASDNGTIVADLNSRISFQEKQKQRYKLAVEKLTHQLNQLTIRYRVKQKELEEQKEKPGRDIIKQRQNYMQSKQFIQKLQQQQRQKQKFSHRKIRTDISPTKSVSPLKYSGESPKKDYLQNISEMGKLENILLQSNITKNKLMTQIDKIDGIKVKTNELYMKRKQHQQQLSRIQNIIFQTKAKLRVLNAI